MLAIKKIAKLSKIIFTILQKLNCLGLNIIYLNQTAQMEGNDNYR